MVPKYNPARTFTPEGAVGLGGTYLCIYPMDSPGGAQAHARLQHPPAVALMLPSCCPPAALLPPSCCPPPAAALRLQARHTSASEADVDPGGSVKSACGVERRVPAGGPHAADLEHVRARQALHAGGALAAALL